MGVGEWCCHRHPGPQGDSRAVPEGLEGLVRRPGRRAGRGSRRSAPGAHPGGRRVGDLPEGGQAPAPGALRGGQGDPDRHAAERREAAGAERRGDRPDQMKPPEPVTLEGHGVRLEPLTLDHTEGLIAAATDGKLWELWFTSVPAPADARKYIAEALAGQREGHMLPWAVRDLATGTIVG